jgi:hypothetical protein
MTGTIGAAPPGHHRQPSAIGGDRCHPRRRAVEGRPGPRHDPDLAFPLTVRDAHEPSPALCMHETAPMSREGGKALPPSFDILFRPHRR